MANCLTFVFTVEHEGNPSLLVSSVNVLVENIGLNFPTMLLGSVEVPIDNIRSCTSENMCRNRKRTADDIYTTKFSIRRHVLQGLLKGSSSVSPPTRIMDFWHVLDSYSKLLLPLCPYWTVQQHLAAQYLSKYGDWHLKSNPV